MIQTEARRGSLTAWLVQNGRSYWPNFLTIIISYGLFLLLITTSGNIKHSISELGSLDGFRGFYGVEVVKDAQGQPLPYSWTSPEASLFLENVPRYAPLELTLAMSLDRPPGVPPGRLEVVLQGKDGRESSILASYQFDPNQPGFKLYKLVIPEGVPPGEPGFTLLLKSNGFKAGDGRELGVRVSGYELKTLTGWRDLFVWPAPYIIAVGLLTTGLLLWTVRLRLSWVETGLLVGPLLIAAARSAQYIQANSWWLVICGLVLVAAVWLFEREGEGRSGRGAIIGPILLAVFAVTGFFITSWPAVYDTSFYLNWQRDISQHGPFGIYSHSQSLNYPPLIVYLLWFYGLLANPLGLATSYTAVKFFLSLSLPALVYLVWRFYAHKLAELPHLPAILLMLGISAGALYNPVVYGQSDAPLVLFLVGSFLLINRGHANLGAVGLALSLLYKLQTVYLLPLLLLLMLKRSGWRKTLLAAFPALGVALLLTLPAFGFDWNEFSDYWNQGQLAGDGSLEYGAFNLLDLLDANSGQVNWIVPVSFGLIALVYAWLAASLWWGRSSDCLVTFACGLALLLCFMLAIKVKQHYLYYPLPFLGLAALFDRHLTKPWLLLGGIYTLMLIVSPVITRRGAVYDNFLTWNRLVAADRPLVENVLAGAGLLIFLYLLGYYGWCWWRERHQVADKAS